MKKPQVVTLALSSPLNIGGKEVTEVRLRRPQPGELRGVRLVTLLSMDVDAVMQVVQRISDPMLDANTLAGMDLFDFGEIAGEVVGFFQRPDPTAPAPSGEDGQTT